MDIVDINAIYFWKSSSVIPNEKTDSCQQFCN